MKFTYHIFDWNRARRDASYAGEYITRQQAAKLALSEKPDERERALEIMEAVAAVTAQHGGGAQKDTLDNITLKVRVK
jgi:hypothetical protein